MSNSLWPMNYTVPGIPQARILERAAFRFSRGLSQPRDWTQVSSIASGLFTSWAMREAHRCVQMWELYYKEGWALKNWCFRIVVLEKTLESPMDCKRIKSVNPKVNQPWIFIRRIITEVEAPILWPPDAKRPTHWKRPWCWERLKAKGEGGGRGWDGWMASLTQWTWIRTHSRRQWRTEEPGMLQSMRSQRVEHNLATEQQGEKGNNPLLWIRI